MKVLKFGGSSVKNADSIKKVIDIVASQAKKNKVFVVVSAFGSTTNNLIKTAKLAQAKDIEYKTIFAEIENHHIDVVKALIPANVQSGIIGNVKRLTNQLETLFDGCFMLEELTDKALATISGFGERLSSYIISEAAKQSLDAGFKDSSELIVTDSNYLGAEVDFEKTNKNCKKFFKKTENQVTILPGFISRSEKGEMTTLGRGGSDYSASIYAAALKAEELQIWTDVSGMFTANPSVVKQAFPISKISYQEAMEMSHFGAKVIYPPTIQPVMKRKIPIVIKNTYEPEHKGTLISKKTSKKGTVKGISYIENISLLTLEGIGMVGVSGISKRLFEVLAEQDINVVMITQASSEHSICVGIYDADAELAVKKINKKFSAEINQGKIDPVILEQNLSIIALVGDKMKNHQSLSGQMFSALGRNNVNIRAIAQGASEKNISAVINSDNAKKALNTLHEQFFEEKVKEVNLFVTGVGNVGNRFLAQIKQQKEYLLENLKLNIRVIGIANSRKMVFNEEGINLDTWEDQLEKGEKATLDNFFKATKKANLRNSVFVDNTANQQVSEVYEKYLSNSISVVTCNKIACASSLENYKTLKKVANKYNASFLYETNVGAGLPIMDTLKNLVASGDKVNKIQGVLSGSLNFVFNNFNENTTFESVVKQAAAEGYTEPDPKIDLSGIDVARKVLILAREAGYDIELEDIENDSFLSQESLDTTNNDDFYASLVKYEADFQKIYKDANDKGCRLKYVGEFSNGKAKVGLQQIPSDHPFYNLEGSDNIVLFFTNRYPENPLLIKGAGAGADVTASGIFADVIRTANS